MIKFLQGLLTNIKSYAMIGVAALVAYLAYANARLKQKNKDLYYEKIKAQSEAKIKVLVEKDKAATESFKSKKKRYEELRDKYRRRK